MNILYFLLNPIIFVPLVLIILMVCLWKWWGNDNFKKFSIIVFGVAALVSNLGFTFVLGIGKSYGRVEESFFIIPLLILVLTVWVVIVQFRNLPVSRVKFFAIWFLLIFGSWIFIKVMGDWNSLSAAVISGSPKAFLEAVWQ